MSGIDRKSLIILAEDASNALSTVLVDASRRLVSVFVGSEGATVKQNATGELVTEIQGSEALAIKQKATTGEMIAVMQGDKGIITQDANNNLISVMKGNFEGALKTWKVDVDGRGEMFINDTTDDWGKKNIIGLAELATRLGAKQGFDNRGRQIWSDGSEQPTIRWIPWTAGGAGIARVATCSWSDGWSIEHNLPAVVGSSALLTKHFYSPGTGRYGIEISVSMDRIDFEEIRLGFYYWTGTHYVEGVVRVVGTTGIVRYLDDTPGWTDIGVNMCLRADIHYWHKIKLVVDINLEEYVRILIDGNEFDLTGIPLFNVLNATCNNISAAFQSWGNATAVNNIYWDDFIFTHLEP